MADSRQRKLDPLEGTFRAKLRFWMGPGEPTTATGTMVNVFELNRTFLRQSYQGDPTGEPFGSFEGRGYMGFNGAEDRFEAFWIDTASTIMQMETGQLDASGKVWTMTGEMPHPKGEGTISKRSVITLESADRHKMEIFMDFGEGETKTMEISFERDG